MSSETAGALQRTRSADVSTITLSQLLAENMGDSSWQRMLKSQHDDLEKMEALDAELNDVKIAEDIEKALKKTKLPLSFSSSNSRRQAQHSISVDDEEDEEYNYRSRPPPPIPTSRPSSALATRPRETGREIGFGSSPHPCDENVRSPAGNVAARGRSFSSKPDDLSLNDEGAESPDHGNGTPKAPDATARYQKARLKLLTKQVEDGQELRKQLSETVNDLQRQLKNEREENKKAKKRVQLLEVETKRSSNKKVSAADTNQATDSVDSLTQEISSLKKDVQTAERIAKQSEVIARSKETHLKRALETITRLKVQVAELQSTTQEGTADERTKLDAAEGRVKILQRQRDDLISAFKKQMKLIDVLKRQKVHIEAARLLAFTEDEFVRTLDWGA